MTNQGLATLRTGQALRISQIPQLPLEDFRRTILTAVPGGYRVTALFGDTPIPGGQVDLYAVLADSARALFHVARTRLEANHFPSMTPDCPQVHLFEHEIAQQCRVCPDGHPWFKPVR